MKPRPNRTLIIPALVLLDFPKHNVVVVVVVVVIVVAVVFK